MSKQSKNTIKSWFKNGAFPNQFHFWDWMDSFFHKDEQIPASQIDSLQDLLDAKVDRKDLPDGEMAMDDISGLNSVLDSKVDKVAGKSLSSEDFSSELKAKLDGLEEGANKYEHPLTHPANMIEETSLRAFISEDEKQANVDHIADSGIHKTSEQIRSEIVDEDIPVSLARVSQLTTDNIVGLVCETLEEAQDKAYDGYACYVKEDQKSYIFKLEEEIILDEENNEVLNQKFIAHENIANGEIEKGIEVFAAMNPFTEDYKIIEDFDITLKHSSDGIVKTEINKRTDYYKNYIRINTPAGDQFLDCGEAYGRWDYSSKEDRDVYFTCWAYVKATNTGGSAYPFMIENVGATNFQVITPTTRDAEGRVPIYQIKVRSIGGTGTVDLNSYVVVKHWKNALKHNILLDNKTIYSTFKGKISVPSLHCPIKEAYLLEDFDFNIVSIEKGIRLEQIGGRKNIPVMTKEGIRYLGITSPSFDFKYTSATAIGARQFWGIEWKWVPDESSVPNGHVLRTGTRNNDHIEFSSPKDCVGNSSILMLAVTCIIPKDVSLLKPEDFTIMKLWKNAPIKPIEVGGEALTLQDVTKAGAITDKAMTINNTLKVVAPSMGPNTSGLDLSNGWAVLSATETTVSRTHNEIKVGAYSTGMTSGVLYLGDLSAPNSDKRILINNEATFDPEIRYDETLNKWRVSHDGVTFSDIGGGGSTQTLQQVTEAGANTDQPVLFEDVVTFGEQIATNNTSPIASTPGGTNATSGKILTADGSGGSSWEDGAGGGGTLQEVTTAGATTDKNVVFSGNLQANGGKAISNLIIGSSAGTNPSFSGVYNVILGEQAGRDLNTTVNSNTLIGYLAGSRSVGGDVTAIGKHAATLFTKKQVVAVGSGAGYSNVTGGDWTAIGYYAGWASTGTSFTAIGKNAGWLCTANNYVAIGAKSGYSVTAGTDWISVGSNNSTSQVTGSNWISLGTYGARYITSGSNYITMGWRAGTYSATTQNVTAMSASIILGYDARCSGTSSTNEIVIGASAYGKGDNTVVIGNSSITDNYFTGKVHAPILQVGTTAVVGQVLTADAAGNATWQDVSIPTVATLQDVTDAGNLTTNNIVTTGTATASNFILSSDERLKTFKNESIVDVSSIDIRKFSYNDDETNRDRYGVSAQELQKVAPEMVYEDEEGMLSVGYTDFLLARIAKLEKLVYKLVEDK